MNNEKIEKVILANLVKNESFARKTLPFVLPEYFANSTEKTVFNQIRSFILDYSGLPTREAILISLEKQKDLFVGDEEYKESITLTEEIYNKSIENNQDWLVTETESFCKDRAIYNAVYNTINILEGKDKNKGRGIIPQLLSDALAVSFDPHIGHDFLKDTEERYKFYTNKEETIACDLDAINKMTNGGVTKKTLNLFMAGTNAGKSMILCHLAASYLTQGWNVLYITLEMSDKKSAKRIDANLLNVPMDDLGKLSEEKYSNKIEAMKKKVTGQLIIREYATGVANVTHFRHLINELQLKKKFKPDIIMLDYINLCSSSRVKYGSNTNSYQMIKSIAEEVRGLAVETNTAIWSATQTNRGGFNSSEMDMTDTSESFGLPMTADTMIGMIRTEELDELNQLVLKQLKNRDGDMSKYKKMIVGLDRGRSRFYDVEQHVHDGLIENKKRKKTEEDTPAFDKTKFGLGMKAERKTHDFSLD